MKLDFESGFAQQIHEMLEHRAAMGRSVKDYSKLLANFDRYCTTHFPNENKLTKEIAFSWCNDAKGIGKGAFNRASALRGFARYIYLTGKEVYFMPTSFFPMPKAKQPVIMNDVELTSFFAAADHYPSNGKDALQEFVVPVIFRLQFACGMRPQEVRSLRCADFSFNDNTIYIAEGKHHKDRCLPINTGVMDLCLSYNRIAEMVTPNRTYFFQAQSGSMYSTDWLCDAFRACWEMSGNGTGVRSCTPYALRHIFATHTLMRWVEEGRDLDSMNTISHGIYGTRQVFCHVLLHFITAGSTILYGLHSLRWYHSGGLRS